MGVQESHEDAQEALQSLNRCKYHCYCYCPLRNDAAFHWSSESSRVPGDLKEAGSQVEAALRHAGQQVGPDANHAHALRHKSQKVSSSAASSDLPMRP